MIQPYLSNSDHWIYTSVDGLIWLNSGLKLPTNLEEKACNAILKIYMEVEIGQPLIVDFRNVKDIADRALDNLFSAFQENNREVLLLSFDTISDQIEKVTNQVYKKSYTDFSQSEGNRCRVLNKLVLDDVNYIMMVNDLRERKMNEFVKSSFIKFDDEQYLKSTPLKATGVFDAAQLLSNHTAFYWICLQMADLVKSLLNNAKVNLSKEIKMLSVNMKATPFASVVSLLTDIPLVTIDHLGPKHKAYDIDILDDLQNLRSYNYIYIGDFCVGGTEIKIARTYARISNSELSTAVVIGSYFNEQHFLPDFHLYSLVNIAKLHPNAKFSI